MQSIAERESIAEPRRARRRYSEFIILYAEVTCTSVSITWEKKHTWNRWRRIPITPKTCVAGCCCNRGKPVGAAATDKVASLTPSAAYKACTSRNRNGLREPPPKSSRVKKGCCTAAGWLTFGDEWIDTLVPPAPTTIVPTPLTASHDRMGGITGPAFSSMVKSIPIPCSTRQRTQRKHDTRFASALRQAANHTRQGIGTVNNDMRYAQGFDLG